MTSPVSIFLNFNLPNATTWFYFSFLLAMALFFKFSRLISIRDLDIVTIFVLVPGLLLIQEARQSQELTRNKVATDLASVVAGSSGQALGNPFAGSTNSAQLVINRSAEEAQYSSSLWVGYLWLLCGSAYFLFRCFLDLLLVRRPALGPNLNFGGLAWLGMALFICLAVVAYRPITRLEVAHLGSKNVEEKQSPVEVKETVGRTTAFFRVAEKSLEPNFLFNRTFAILCHLSVIVGLIMVGARHFGSLTSGMAAATFYLLLPYTGYYVGQVHHVWPMALMIWAVVLYKHPTFSGLFLGIAVGTVFFPALVVPVWIGFYWKRGAGRFSAACLLTAGFCLGITGLMLWLDNNLGSIITNTLAIPDWQPWKVPEQEGFWTGVHWAYRMPVFIAYIALAIMTALWPNPKNLAHLLAMSTAVLIGIQFWYADRGGVYVLWYLPFFLLLIFRPNMSERRPPQINPDTDWLKRFLGWAKKKINGLSRTPDSVVRTP